MISRGWRGSVAAVAAVCVVGLPLSGCGKSQTDLEWEAFDACRTVAFATSSLTELREVLSTNPDCVMVEAEVLIRTVNGDERDVMIDTSRSIMGPSPYWLDYGSKSKADKAIAQEQRAQQKADEKRDEELREQYADAATCVWDPTENWDWHDDYVCGGVRQYFRGWDDFVTPEEMAYEARQWERRHN